MCVQQRYPIHYLTSYHILYPILTQFVLGLLSPMSSDDDSHPITPGPTKSSTKDKDTKPIRVATSSDVKKEPLTSKEERDLRHMEREFKQQQQEIE